MADPGGELKGHLTLAKSPAQGQVTSTEWVGLASPILVHAAWGGLG